MARIQKNDYGTRFELTITDQDGAAVDISSATTKALIFESPGETVSSKAATFTTNGTDGKIYWDATEGFLDTIGRWKLQGKYVDGDQQNRTELTFFYVQDILE